MSNIKSAIASGSHKIGFLTWYDCRNTHVTPSRLRMLFDKHNLDEKHFPEGIKEKNAFQKSVRRAVSEISQTSDDRRSIAKLIVDGMNKIVYGVVDLNVHEVQESIEPDFSDRIWLDKGTLTVQYDKGHDLSLKVKDIYNQLCGEYTTRDISRMIVKTMDGLCSVPLRDAGGIYFVPISYEKEMHALQAVVNDLGDCNMRVYSLGSGDGNVDGVEQAAKSQIQDKISSLKDEIINLHNSMEDGSIKGQTIENGIEIRLRKFKELKLRCGILADVLRVKANSIEGDLNAIKQMIDEKLKNIIDGPSEVITNV